MITSIIACMFLLLAVSGASVLAGRRSEACWPVCFCSVIVWLYGFYCFGMIRPGLILLCGGILCLFLLGWRKIGSIREYCIRIFTPGTVIYLIFCLSFFLFFSRNLVSRHDELRLWGAVPKAIHETGMLQLGTDSPIFSIMQSYPPALPLMGYFFTAFSSDFSEGALYVGYACMALSFFIPAFSKWQWKHWHILTPVGLLVFLTPFVFTSHFADGGLFGMTLFVDPLLGIAAGFAFYLAGHRPLQDGFRLTAFSLILGVLCLLKDTGAVFAVTALALSLILDRRNWNLRCLIPVGAAAISAGSWKLLLTLHDVQALIQMKIHVLSSEAVGNVLRALVSTNMIAAKVPLGFFLSFVFLSMVLWLLYWIAFCLQSEQTGREAGAVAAGILISTAAMIYGYSLIYGETLESFARYMATPLLALFTCILLTAIPTWIRGKLADWAIQWKTSCSVGILCSCVAMGVAVFAFWMFIFPIDPNLPSIDRDAEQIRMAVEQDISEDETAWIYLVMAGDGWENSFYHHRIFFDLISSNINIRNGLAQTQVVIPGLENPTEKWAEELADGCDYVYLLSVEDALIPVFRALSDDLPQEHGLYRVCREETGYGISLHLVP